MSTPATGSAQRRKPAGWMSKRHVVFAGVLGGIAGLAMSTRTWIHVVPAQGAINVQPFDVSGKDAATAVAALAVVALAGSVAAAIAGRTARWIVAVLVFLSGLGIAGSAATALADPVGRRVEGRRVGRHPAHPGRLPGHLLALVHRARRPLDHGRGHLARRRLPPLEDQPQIHPRHRSRRRGRYR